MEAQVWNNFCLPITLGLVRFGPLSSRILPTPGQLCQVFSLAVWPIFNQSFKCRWWRAWKHIGQIQYILRILKWWTRPQVMNPVHQRYTDPRLPNTSWEGVLGMFSVFGVQIPPHKVFGSLGWMKGSWNTEAFMKISDSGNRETRWRVAVQTGFQTESNKRLSHNGGRWMIFLNNEPHLEACQDS